jgi:putative ABC transport system permease protein
MFKNYFKIASRNLLRNKAFSLLNILGLAIGLAACLFILQYVSFELSYDRFHANAPDIYRVINDRYQNGKLIQHGTVTYSAIGKAMKDDFPEVLENARVVDRGEVIISYNDKKLSETHTLAVDNSFLQMFSFPLIAGHAATALTDANTVVISESLTRKIFSYQGSDFNQFIGKALVFFREERPYKITGICRNVPENSHLQFNLLISYPTIISSWKEADYSFTESSFWHYIQLKPGTDYNAFEARFDAFSKRHFDGSKVSGSGEKFYLQPVSRAHLYSDFEYEIGIVGSSTVVWSLFIIAIFIIAIAWINYINLATAKAVDRAKEVGVRKVLGAYRGQLIGQFLSEAFLINCIGLIIALILVYLLQPGFNGLLSRQYSLAFLFKHGLGNSFSITGLGLIMLAGIVLSGFYPAFVLSSFMPITVLKGKYSTSKQGIALRKGLVVAQFTATIVLIVGSMMVYRQMKFVSNKELGLNMDQVLVVHPPQLTTEDSTFKVRIESFKNAVKGLSGVKGATTTRNLPGDELGRAFNVHRIDATDDTRFTTRLLSVNYDFTDVYNIKLVAGRKLLPSDHNSDWEKLHNLVINEKAVKLLGLSSPEEAIGKSILIFNKKKMDIVGVMADYHQKSLHSPIEPILLFPSYGNGDPISVKVATDNLPQTLASIRKQYETFFPGNLFDYFFLKERYNQQYKDDAIFTKVFGLFAGFAVFVACLGLFGLSLFTTAQRMNEIGMRKVLGASAFQIVSLLSRDFLKLIILAIAIASPIGWYAVNKWLENFAYSTSIAGWVFVVAGLIALLIALLTVSFQAIKSALANPIKSLRTE